MLLHVPLCVCVYQSTAAAALGFVGRRAAAERNLAGVAAVISALLPPLGVELAVLQVNSFSFQYSFVHCCKS